MERFEAFSHLNENVPDFRLGDELAFLLTVENLLEEVAVVDVLHDDTGKLERRELPYQREADASSMNASL